MPKKEVKPVMNLEKTWIILLTFVIILFSVVGTVMIFFDTRYLTAVQYLVTAAAFIMAINLIHAKKLSPTNQFFYLGFIFTIVGFSTNPGLWSFGFVLFLAGLYGKKF